MNFPGFIYLDLNRPYVAWETYRGVLISADQIKIDIEKNPSKISIMFATIIRDCNNQTLSNELLIEQIRSNEFPELVSRLKGLFIFKDLKSAQNATVWGGYYNRGNRVNIDVSTEIEPIRLDEKWISKFKKNEGIITEDSIGDIRKYWSGEPYDGNPRWEYLINGTATIRSANVRNRAYNVIQKNMHGSIDILKLSRYAYELDSDLGHCIPWIQRIAQNEFKLQYFMNFEDAKNDVFLKKLQKYYPKKRKNFVQINGFNTPYFQPEFREFKLSNDTLYGYSILKIIPL